MSRNDRWWVTINGHSVGEQQKSLNQKILHARYIASGVIQELYVEAQVADREFTPVTIRIMKGTLRERAGGYYMENVEELAKDVIG